MDDLDTLSADAMGRSLRGIGLNLLTRDVPALACFLRDVFDATTHQESTDFAAVQHGGMVLQLHSHRTFAAHPLHGFLPEGTTAGAGVQIYLYGADPDTCVARAESVGAMVLEPPRDKPHGLREATILSDEGFAFTAAAPLAEG
ncbi:MAG: glyoxalase [Pseudomonadota bacterium]